MATFSKALPSIAAAFSEELLSQNIFFRRVDISQRLFLCTVHNRSSRPEVFCEKGILRNFAKFTRKYLYQRLFLIKLLAMARNFIKKESLTQVFSCEFCEISKNTFFYRTSLVAFSGTATLTI